MSEIRRRLIGKRTPDKYIRFKDPVVAKICAEKWGDGIGLTLEQAAAVTDIGTTFQGNTEITSFDEFEYFTRVMEIFGDNSNGTNGGFYNCISLMSVRVPDNLIRFGYGAFYQCYNLKNINIPKVCQYIERWAFADTKIDTKVEVRNLQRIGQYAFKESNITAFIAPDYQGDIQEGVFKNCKCLVELEIPKVVRIATGAFHSSNLNGVVLDLPNLISIGYGTFTNTNIVRIVDLGSIKDFNSNVSAANAAFAGCKNLTEVILPRSIETINHNVFNGCSSLNAVVLEKEVPPILGTSVFTSTPINMCIYVPDNSVEIYKAETEWKLYVDKIKPISEYSL